MSLVWVGRQQQRQPLSGSAHDELTGPSGGVPYLIERASTGLDRQDPSSHRPRSSEPSDLAAPSVACNFTS